MKFRPHRGSLSEAMREVVKLDPTMDEWTQHLLKSGEIKNEDPVSVEYYAYDARGWGHTYMVKVGLYPVGFTNAPV
jgi:hypothetical protein